MWRRFLQFSLLMCCISSSMHSSENTKTASLIDQLANPIKNILLPLINEQIHGSLTYDSLDFSLPNRVSLIEPKLSDPFGNIIISAKRIDAAIDLKELFYGNIIISSADAFEPYMHLTLFNKYVNIAHTFKTKPNPLKKKLASAKPKKPLFKVNNARVHDGTFEFVTDVGVYILSSNVNAHGDVFGKKGGGVYIDLSTATSAHGIVSVNSMSFPYENLVSTQTIITEDYIETPDFRIDVLESKLKSRGALDWDAHEYDLHGSFDAPHNTWPDGLKKLLFEIPALSANYQLKGPLDHPIIELTAKFESTNAFGFDIESGVTVGTVTRSGINVEKANINLKNNGVLEGNIFVGPKEKTWNDLLITANGKGTNIYQQNVGIKKFDFSLTSLLTNDDIFDFNASFKDAGLNASTKGQLSFKQHRVAVNLAVESNNPVEHFKSLPKQIKAQKLEFKGSAAGAFDNIVGTGNLKLASLTVFDINANNVESDISIDRNRVTAQKINGLLFTAPVRGNVDIALTKKPSINLQLSAKGMAVNNSFKLPEPITALHIQGTYNARFELSGPMDDLNFSLLVDGDKSYLNNFPCGQFFAEFHKQGPHYTLNNISINSPSIIAKGDELIFDIEKKLVQGSLELERFDLSPLAKTNSFVPKGTAHGSVSIDGSLDNPQINADLFLTDASVVNRPIGDGHLHVSVATKKHPATKAKSTIVSASALLSNNDERFQFRGSYEPKSDKVRAQVLIDNAAIGSWINSNDSWIMPFSGNLFGEISVEGVLSNPTAQLRLNVPLLSKDPTALETPIKSLGGVEPIGSFESVISLKNHLFQGLVCAFSQQQLGKGCDPSSKFQAQFHGKFFNFSNYNLTVNGNIDYQNIEQLITMLYKEQAHFDSSLQFKTFYSVQNGVSNLRGDIDFNRIELSLPGIPLMKLDQPFAFSFNNDSVFFKSRASFSSGKDYLHINGNASKDKLAFFADGRIPLILSKFIVSTVSGASGSALGTIDLQGSLKHPNFSGQIAPENGAYVSVRKLPYPIIFTGGQLVFHSQKTGGTVFEAQNLKYSLGEGRGALTGDIKFFSSKDKPEWNLRVTGSNIRFFEKEMFFEGNFDIQLQTIANANWLHGFLEISDGAIKNRFALHDFVLQSETPIALWPKQEPTWLYPLHLNIDLRIQSFASQAFMVAFRMDANFAADLKFLGLFSQPRLEGTVELTEGQLTFPAATFDISPAIIPFRKNPTKLIDPQIDINALAELSHTRFPALGMRDTTIQISLKGNSLNQLQLGIEPISGNTQLSPTLALILLLSPSSTSSSSNLQTVEDLASTARQDISNSQFASILLPAVSGELQSLIEQSVGGKFYIGGTLVDQSIAARLKWQIDPRLELEGTAAATTSLPVQDLKLRFLLFDHLPVGKKLSFEGTFLAPSAIESTNNVNHGLELSYRVLER